MDANELVREVQARGNFSSTEQAQQVIRATLETIAERLDYHVADNLAVQLPAEIGRHLRTDASPQSLSFNDLIRRVAVREGLGTSLAEVRRHTRAVLDVVQEALTFGAAEKLRQQFPSDFEPLFDARTPGEFSAERRG